MDLESNLKRIIRNIKAKNCALVLVSAGLGIAQTGCVITIEVPDNFIENFSISSDNNGNYNIKYENTCDTYAVITDAPKVTTDSSITDVMESTIVTTDRVCEIEETTSFDVYETDNFTTTVITNPPMSTTSVEVCEPEESVTTVLTNPPMPTVETSIVSSYFCCYGYGEYKVCCNDTLDNISNMTGMTKEELMILNNMENENINEGDYIAAPALLVMYTINNDYTVDEVSYQTGISKEEICRLNSVDEDFIFNKGYTIIVNQLFGGELAYPTSKGRANVVNNTII